MTLTSPVLRLAATALLFASGACESQPRRSPGQAAAAAARGVYVVVGPAPAARRGPRAAGAFTSPASGIYVRTLWSAIEPRSGVFDWSGLDADVAAARRAGKRVSIGIRAGEGTPAWLLDQTRTISLIVGRRRGTAGHCEPLRISLPWDRRYLAAYGQMMAALSSHLKATGGYQAVSIVKLTGMNSQTEELHLPSEQPAERQIAAGTACRISDSTTVWHGAGYRPALAFDAWKSLATSIGTAFPDKLLSLPIIGSSDFPKMDANGSPVAKASAGWVDVKAQIVAAGVRMFPGRFAVQWNGLNERRVPPAIESARAQGAIIGLQSNLRRGPGGGAGCNLTRGTAGQPCSGEQYRALLAFGERAGAAFLEVWPVDAQRFGPAIAESVNSLH